ncbi:MAG: anaerobic ribonucleoside-triphosphate reductase activating protein [Lachnospiraceae bacterium]
MLIAGLQKMSLVDFPGKVACTVFTGGCNLRCPFCHNSELLVSPPPAMSEEEFFSFLKKRTGLLDGVCVSGGEPCLQKDLPDFLRKLRQLPFAIKLDTNGLFPSMLETVLRESLVDYVAMDIKNSPDRFLETTGLAPSGTGSEGHSEISHFQENVHSGNVHRNLSPVALLLSSTIPFELRTTVVSQFHDRRSFERIRDMLLPFVEEFRRKVPAYYLQPFKDRETVPFAGLEAPSEDDLKAFAEILTPVADVVEIRGI